MIGVSNMSENDQPQAPSLDALELWERSIFARYGNKCFNCESDKNLAVKPVVPLTAGGQLVPTNGIVICRRCEMISEAASQASGGEFRRPVNFLVSRYLYDLMTNLVNNETGPKSMGALIRYLISMYIDNTSRFDDLEQYQDDGSDVKINVWIDEKDYAQFKKLLGTRGVTITNAIKALVMMYASETNYTKRNN